MLLPIAIAVGTVAAIVTTVEVVKNQRAKTAATVAATNAQVVQPAAVAATAAPIQQVAQQAAVAAQQDTADPNGGGGVPAGTPDPVVTQQAAIAAQQAVAGNVVVGPAQDNTSTIDPATGLNTQQGVDPIAVNDPTLAQQAANLLGI